MDLRKTLESELEALGQQEAQALESLGRVRGAALMARHLLGKMDEPESEPEPGDAKALALTTDREGGADGD